MNRLWVRLTLSHSVLVTACILAITLVVTQLVDLSLRREAARQIAQGSGFINRLPNLLQNGDWRNERGPNMPRLVFADQDGKVLYDWRGGGEGRYLDAFERRLALPVLLDGKLVGYLLPLSASALSDDYMLLAAQMRRAVLITAILAAVLALGLSLLISQSVTQPLQRLVAGARAIATKHLNERITPTGPEETRELAAAFNQMATSLETAEQNRAQMTADIAHELRTPLAVLQGNLAAMMDGVYPVDAKEIASLYDETLRLSRLVQDLSLLAAGDAGQLQLEMVELDLRQPLLQAVTLFQPAAESQGVTLVTNWPETLPEVVGDSARIGQVLNNLLSNALRHTPADGKVELGAKVLDKNVEVWVQDNGEGITAEDLPHIFDRLWRGDRSRSREHGGSGLGLAIAKQLVEGMGGSIGVASEHRQGARFWFRLPVPTISNVEKEKKL